MKMLKTYLILHTCIAFTFLNGQGNPGFEGGDLSVWKTFKNGNLINPLILMAEKGMAIMKDSMRVNDKVNEPAVCPWAGMNSIRLGYVKSGSNVSVPVALEREITITEDEFSFDYWISYYYEIHESYYSVQFYDSTTIYHSERVNLDFLNRNFSFIVNGLPGIRFQKWKQVSVKLNNLKGKKIKVRFEVRGCPVDVHKAYIFLDFNCNKMNESLRTYQCADNVLLKLSKPGYHQIFRNNQMFFMGFNGDSLRFKWDTISKLTILSYDDTSCSELNNIPLNNKKRFADFNVSEKSCLYDTLQFTNRSTQFKDYVWDFGKGPFVENKQLFKLRFQTAGYRTLTLIAKDTFCSDTVSKPFVVFEYQHNIKIARNQFCYGDTARLFCHSNPVLSQVKWHLDSEWILKDTLTISKRSTGVHEIRLCATDTNGCIDTISSNYTVHEKPNADFLHSSLGNNLFDFQPLILNSNNKYTWYISQDTIEEMFVNRIVKDSVFRVMLKVENEFTCFDKSAVWIKNKQSYIFIPNAFYPSHSGFKPYTSKIYNYHLEIYNRWGELLFETRDPDESWDGTFRGELVPQDVYAYFIHCTDAERKRDLYKGSVTVLR